MEHKTPYDLPIEPTPSATSAGNGDVSRREGLEIADPETEKERLSFWALFKKNWVETVTYCLVFWSFGMGVAFLGPTVFDLGCQTESDMKKMNWVFFAQLLLVLIGSITGGMLATKLYIQVLLIIGTFGMTVTTFALPICFAFPLLVIDMMIMGWCMGLLDCVSNLAMIQIYGSDVSPFLQAMHFFYGLGAFTSPLIASHYILSVDCTPYIDGYTAHTTHALAAATTMAPLNASLGVTKETLLEVGSNLHKVTTAAQLSKVGTAFVILGLLQLPVACLVLGVFIKEWRFEQKHGKKSKLLSPVMSPSKSDSNGIAATNCFGGTNRCLAFSSREVILIVVLSSAALFFSDGLQSSYAEYLFSYAEKTQDDLPQSEGATMSACFWGLFAFGRLLAIPLAAKFTPVFMLTLNSAGCILAILISMMFQTSGVALYIGTCIVGISLSSMSPTLICITELFIDINPSITACLVVCAALGETLCPLIVGTLFTSIGPRAFLAFCFTVIGADMLLSVVLYLVGQKTVRYKDLHIDSFIWLPHVRNRSRAGESTLIKPTSIKYYSRMKDDSDTTPAVTPSEPATNNVTVDTDYGYGDPDPYNTKSTFNDNRYDGYR